MTTVKSNGRAASSGGPTSSTPNVVIDQIEVEKLTRARSSAPPLIVNRFSEKAKRQMLDAMQGRKTPKQPKDPKAEYEAAFYRFE